MEVMPPRGAFKYDPASPALAIQKELEIDLFLPVKGDPLRTPARLVKELQLVHDNSAIMATPPADREWFIATWTEKLKEVAQTFKLEWSP